MHSKAETALQHIDNVRDAVFAVKENCDRLGSPGKENADTRKILMEIRHDLEDALKSVKKLEELRESYLLTISETVDRI